MTGYIKRYYGDDSYFPDSARKRHNRYVDDHKEIMVFNFGGGGGCCGGGSPWGLGLGCCHHSNTFWGGFGHGFGAGIANFLGGFGMGLMGLCSPMFNMFGGFGMPTFTMPSFSMPMWGNFMPYSNVGWGGVQATPSGSTGTGSTPPATPSAADKAKQEVETELDKINKNAPQQEELQNALNKLEAKKEELDPGYYKQERINLLESAKQHGFTLQNADGTEIDLDAELIPKDWNKPPLNTLKPEQINRLIDMGVKPQKVGSEWCLSLPSLDKINATNLADLCCGIPVAVANNKFDKNTDNWIVGTINEGSITELGGKVSFEINCATFAASSRKYTYQIEQKDNNKWTITYISGYDKSNDGTLYTKPNSEYKYRNGILETNSLPVISKHKGTGYDEIKK